MTIFTDNFSGFNGQALSTATGTWFGRDLSSGTQGIFNNTAQLETGGNYGAAATMRRDAGPDTSNIDWTFDFDTNITIADLIFAINYNISLGWGNSPINSISPMTGYAFKIRISNDELHSMVLYRCTNGSASALADTPEISGVTTTRRLRFNRSGSQIQITLWDPTLTEPSPQIDFTDSSPLGSGVTSVGIRRATGSTNIINIDDSNIDDLSTETIDLTLNNLASVPGIETISIAKIGTGVQPQLPPAIQKYVTDDLNDILKTARIKVNQRFELLNEQDVVIDDITNFVSACTIEHGNFRTIHRTIEIDINRELDWGLNRIKPYVQLETIRGNTPFIPLGVFVLTAPEKPAENQPVTYHVEGFDKLYIIDQQISQSFVAEVGQPVLSQIRNILQSRNIDDEMEVSAARELIGSSLSYGYWEDITELNIINELLDLVNYRGLFMTPDGKAKSQRYIQPPDQPVTYSYSTEDPSTTVKLQRTLTFNFTDAPNRWIFWNADVDRDDPPIFGDGLYIVDNTNDGPASQSARGGIVVTKKEGLQANSQAELEELADRMVAEDKKSRMELNFQSSINPYHSHFDVIRFDDARLGISERFQHVTWSINLFTGEMNHECRSIEQF